MTTMIDLTGDSPPCTPPPKPNRYQPKQLCANDLTSRLQKICSPFAVRNVNTKTLPQLSRNNIRQLTPATADSGISTRNHSERAVLQEADPLQPQELLEQEAEALDLQLDRRAYPTTSSWKKYPVRQSSKLPWHHDISAEQYTAYLEPKLSALARTSPRFLIRAHSSGSQGFNSSTRIASSLRHPYKKVGKHLKYLANGQHMLTEHLLWQTKATDDFISWTSSLLFALQRASWAEKKGDKDICITFIDTWHPSLANIEFYRGSTLLDILEVEDEDKTKRKFYTHEYLCLGEVLLSRHYSSTISYEKLIECGLFRVFPDLKPLPGERVWLYKSIMQARFGPQFDHEWRLSTKNLRLLRGLVDILKGQNLYLPFAAALLSLRKHNLDDENVVNLMAYVLSGHDSPCYFLQNLRPDHAWMDKEVREFARILNVAHEMWMRLPASFKDLKSSYWPGAHLKRQTCEQEDSEEVVNKKIKISKDIALPHRAPYLSLTEWIKLMLGKERSNRRRPWFRPTPPITQPDPLSRLVDLDVLQEFGC